jgi:acetylornithine/succinyldiaminopimelate/putrescine aminotransferase
MGARTPFQKTCEQLVDEQIPNLFRLYLNPYVAQTCLCLERYVQTTWHKNGPGFEPWQSFLANSFDEALSGAIKLARYSARMSGRPPIGVMLDAANRLDSFAYAVAHGTPVEFLPGLHVVQDGNMPSELQIGFIVLTSVNESWAESLLQSVHQSRPYVIQCIDRAGLDHARSRRCQFKQVSLPPDIVVFDESFVSHDVPFGAFTARQSLYDHWNKSGKSIFHSTTFQPNTISTLHFMKCLEQADPELVADIGADLQRIVTDLDFRLALFRRLYSPSLAKAIRMTGFDSFDVRAAGNFVFLNGRQVFDAIGGVACSVRGHNPPSFTNDLASLTDADCEAEVREHLQELTGLEHLLPAVSGASAVETALKVALVAQSPRRHVLALKSGFGGKTLLALTSTWKVSYKENLDPLYPDVSFVDPFAPNALDQIDAVLDNTPVAVVQIELIQGVGGVRCVPEAIVRHLADGRAKHGYLLLIDEVQTGMYRTGPFTRSIALGVEPDLLIVGKAVSDMIFPFALTLYSERVHRLLEEAGSTLPDKICKRYSYIYGYRTALGALRFAKRTRLSSRVAESSALFAELLHGQLASCRIVREVRVFGLLIAIELNASRWPQRWFRKWLYQIYLASMLSHERFPVLVGFCQYEPNVLKITPPLTVGKSEIEQICITIGETLRRPFHQLLASVVRRFDHPFRGRSKRHGSNDAYPTVEPKAYAALDR